MHHCIFHACVTTSLWPPPTHAHMAASDLCTCSHLPHTHAATFLTHVAHTAASLTHVARTAASLTLPAPLWPWPSHHPCPSAHPLCCLYPPFRLDSYHM